MNQNEKNERELIASMGRLDEAAVQETVALLLDSGYGRYKIIELLNQGMYVVEKLFEKGDYFIADLIASGVIYSSALECLPPVASDSRLSKGRILIGVVRYDIHDIGKNIVCSLLKSEGFDVIDLGTDVSIDTFVSETARLQPDIIALSGVLSYSAIEMKNAIHAIRNAAQNSNAKIIIGGACANNDICKSFGADAYVETPMDTLNYCKEQIEKND